MAGRAQTGERETAEGKEWKKEMNVIAVRQG